ncbi:glycosyltransferase [Xylanibacillus composti]|uniref:Glycosyl transferase family 1 domain-containing protein n=1 Tax=Xylanibacillus composti TaxID=1572762 RepID=A0A8J4H0X4_9BACL|nr:glycosyltransferase family 4 protein [Xylanibacillus composti]MDT9727124.1 glycosyltransferase [Xylanibacillus composti]GIQ68864.1 hypothetical protein XYCOK13_16880 [Xylanibacillus composti]
MNNEAAVGYLGRQWRRINQRVVEKQWLDNLREYMPVTVIPPSYVRELFGASFESLVNGLPGSLDHAAAVLQQIRSTYGINMLYLNLPTTIPVVLMARNHAGLDLGVSCIAHCVGSAFWLKLWVSIVPWLTERDVVMVSSESSKQALTNLSSKYELARKIPLGIRQPVRNEVSMEEIGRTPTILSIGRLEDVKNIHIMLECFARIVQHVPDAKLIVAGEYTGHSDDQVEQYERKVNALIRQLQLAPSVELTGPVVGERKDALFRHAAVLLNLSTDIGETFGYNLIEAKAWGLPVVCTSWNGFREIVSHGEDGYLVDCSWEGSLPQMDRSQVVEYCVQLLQNKKKHETFAAQALERAAAFSYERTTPLIVQALKDAAQASTAGAASPGSLLNRPLSGMEDFYRLNRLEKLDWLDETPFSLIPTSFAHYDGTLDEWYAKVKPIMEHYVSATAGGKGGAYGMEVRL